MKYIIVVRKDLGMGVGKIAGQVGHAVANMLIHIYDSYGDNWAYKSYIKPWYEGGNQAKIILKINSEQELKDLIDKADNIQTYPVYDAGKTQIEPNTLTCCGFGPDESEKLDKLLGHLKLL